MLRKKRDTIFIGFIAAAVLAVGCGSSQTSKQNDIEVTKAPNNSWVSVSGSVSSVADDSFVLDYGAGTVLVEMDDWDWYPEGRNLIVDDDVVVYGYIDDDFFEKRSIEASSVYVKDLGTQFFANGVDEEDFHTVTVVEYVPEIQISGTVEKVSGSEFQLRTSNILIDVSVDDMAYNPLDDLGYQQVQTGDRVRVTGAMGYDLFNDLDLMAKSVVTIEKNDSDKS